RRKDEPLYGRLRSLFRTKHGPNGLVGQHLRQAIGAEQVYVALLRRDGDDVDRHGGPNTYGTAQVLRLGTGHPMIRHRVISRYLLQPALAEPIATAVADMADEQAALVWGKTRRTDGGAHSLEFRHMDGEIQNGHIPHLDGTRELACFGGNTL